MCLHLRFKSHSICVLLVIFSLYVDFDQMSLTHLFRLNSQKCAINHAFNKTGAPWSFLMSHRNWSFTSLDLIFGWLCPFWRWHCFFLLMILAPIIDVIFYALLKDLYIGKAITIISQVKRFLPSKKNLSCWGFLMLIRWLPTWHFKCQFSFSGILNLNSSRLLENPQMALRILWTQIWNSIWRTILRGFQFLQTWNIRILLKKHALVTLL